VSANVAVNYVKSAASSPIFGLMGQWLMGVGRSIGTAGQANCTQQQALQCTTRVSMVSVRALL
jgi:hypothetical protein